MHATTLLGKLGEHCGNWFSPSAMWGPRMELGVSDQAADTTHSPAELSVSWQPQFGRGWHLIISNIDSDLTLCKGYNNTCDPKFYRFMFVL